MFKRLLGRRWRAWRLKGLPIVVWALHFKDNNGGNIVLHTLASRLAERGFRVYLATPKTFSRMRRRRRTRFARLLRAVRRRLDPPFAYPLPRAAPRRALRTHPTMMLPTALGADGRPFIALYPEIVDQNPFQAPYVVRWLLNRPGVLTPGTRFGPGELTFAYQKAFAEGAPPDTAENLLQVRWLRDDVYRNEGRADRQGACRMVRKGSATYSPDLSKADAFPPLDGKSHEEIAEIFNRCSVFYCHDPYTMYLYYAALCGCTPIVIPQPGLDAASWRAGFELKQGVAYGEAERAWAEATREGLLADMAAAVRVEEQGLDRFIEKLCDYVRG